MIHKIVLPAGLVLALLAAPALAHEATMTVYRGGAVEQVKLDDQGRAGPNGMTMAGRHGGHEFRHHHRRHHRGIHERPGLRPIASGETLWLKDPAEGDLIACELVKRSRVGQKVIACERSSISRALRRSF